MLTYADNNIISRWIDHLLTKGYVTGNKNATKLSTCKCFSCCRTTTSYLLDIPLPPPPPQLLARSFFGARTSCGAIKIMLIDQQFDASIICTAATQFKAKEAEIGVRRAVRSCGLHQTLRLILLIRGHFERERDVATPFPLLKNAYEHNYGRHWKPFSGPKCTRLQGFAYQHFPGVISPAFPQRGPPPPCA